MASIHISEIRELLVGRGQRDAAPNAEEGFFLEIRFDDPAYESPIDPKFRDKVLTADSPSGTVTIQFDGRGLLRSIDLS